MSLGLSKPEVFKVVNDFIGVSQGYLIGFSYRIHREFYPSRCDLDINPDELPGTTRERFIVILSNSEPHVQAKILTGLLDMFPPENDHVDDREKRARLRCEMLEIINRLKRHPDLINPHISSDTVNLAIKDARTLLKENGAVSAVDRVHTVLHGYVKTVCDQASISYGSDPTLTELFKVLREFHPKLQSQGPRPEQIVRIQRAISTLMDTLNPLRNRHSVAHPNDDLLEEPEAMFVIDLTQSILRYLDSKFSE